MILIFSEKLRKDQDHFTLGKPKNLALRAAKCPISYQYQKDGFSIISFISKLQNDCLVLDLRQGQEIIFVVRVKWGR